MVSVVGVPVLLFFLVAVLCFWLFHSAIVILIVVSYCESDCGDENRQA